MLRTYWERTISLLFVVCLCARAAEKCGYIYVIFPFLCCFPYFYKSYAKTKYILKRLCSIDEKSRSDILTRRIINWVSLMFIPS